MKKVGLLILSVVVLMQMGCNHKPSNSMTYRPLGNTGLKVSEISIGCGGFEKLDSAASIALMDIALDSGMNYIDIYDANPITRSNIGAALKGRRDRMIIQGHIGTIFKDGQHTRTRDLEETKQGFEDLLQRLPGFLCLYSFTVIPGLFHRPPRRRSRPRPLPLCPPVLP